MRINHTAKRHQARGFTLIEMLVSLGVFATVMVVATGTLVVLVEANTRAEQLQTATSNLSFALDSMTRNIRTGFGYYCAHDGASGSIETQIENALGDEDLTEDCPSNSPGAGFVFTDSETGERVGYQYYTDDNNVPRLRVYDEDGTARDVTSPEVYIGDFGFIVTGSSRSDSLQPTVQIYLSGYVRDGADTKQDFKIQSFVTQRTLDN